MKVDRDVRFSTVPEWLIFADVSAYAVRVWAVLDRKADSSTGACQVSLSTIAKLARCSVNTVKKALRELESAGAVKADRRRTGPEGDYEANSYTLLTSDPSSRDGGRASDDQRGRARGDQGVGHDVATKERKPLRKPKPRKKDLASAPLADGFDEFWKHYPRKEDKADARRAWDKRIKAGTAPQDLIDGAERFAAWAVAALQVGELESKKYIKLPATWLNKGSEENVLHEPGRAPAAMSKIERMRAERSRRDGVRDGAMGSGASGGNGVRRVGLGDAPRDVRALARGDR